MSATILDFKNLYYQIQSASFFTKVKETSKTNWNLNNLYTDYRLFKVDIESDNVSVADLSNTINRLLYDIDIAADDITELKNLCSNNNITYANHFFEIEHYREGYFDYEKDALIDKKPQNGYILNDNNNWVPPTAVPQEGPVGVGSTGVYVWNGTNLDWEIVYPGEATPGVLL